MTRAVRICVAAAVAMTAATGLTLAQASKLNVKLGLWEMTLQVDLPGGMPPGIDTSKMTAEQRAQIEAMMRGRGMTGPNVIKNCLTKEDLDQNRMQEDTPGTSCTTKVTKETATLVELTQTCTGAGAGTRESRIEAPTPTTVKMTAKTLTGRGAGTTVTMTGKWLSAACGDVK